MRTSSGAATAERNEYGGLSETEKVFSTSPERAVEQERRRASDPAQVRWERNEDARYQQDTRRIAQEKVEQAPGFDSREVSALLEKLKESEFRRRETRMEGGGAHLPQRGTQEFTAASARPEIPTRTSAPRFLNVTDSDKVLPPSRKDHVEAGFPEAGSIRAGSSRPQSAPLQSTVQPQTRVPVFATASKLADANPEPEPVIQVTIGRVEVRAVQQAPTPRKEIASPVMSLEEYLRQRGAGAGR